MKALILGCGPAGLMAAQGVLDGCMQEDDDADVHIVSRRRPSDLYGAQYLHRPIPGISVSSCEINYTLRGDTDGYKEKVYGPKYIGNVSPEDLLGTHMAWDIRATYRRLWSYWEDDIIDDEISPAALRTILDRTTEASWDLIINSIPRTALCHDESHQFGYTTIWAAGDAPDRGIRIPYTCPEGMVVCNGEDNPSWYRMSRVFGHTTVEWPGDIGLVPIQTAAQVQKPTSTNCTCWPQIKHVGRYGTWRKGVLSHEAYFDGLMAAQTVLEAGSVTPA